MIKRYKNFEYHSFAHDSPLAIARSDPFGVRTTRAYPLGLRPALREFASLRSATSDTPQPLYAIPKMRGLEP